MNLMSRELTSYEIGHNIEEPVLHCALCFGYGKYYFNTIEKKLLLNNWIDKIYKSSKLNATFHQDLITENIEGILKNNGL